MLHAWNGDAATAVKLCEFFAQCYVGICGVATFAKAAHVRELCFDVPNDRFLICSNAPRAPPSTEGAAGVPALPCHITVIADAIAVCTLVKS